MYSQAETAAAQLLTHLQVHAWQRPPPQRRQPRKTRGHLARQLRRRVRWRQLKVQLQLTRCHAAVRQQQLGRHADASMSRDPRQSQPNDAAPWLSDQRRATAAGMVCPPKQCWRCFGLRADAHLQHALRPVAGRLLALQEGAGGGAGAVDAAPGRQAGIRGVGPRLQQPLVLRRAWRFSRRPCMGCTRLLWLLALRHALPLVAVSARS